jgi:hypothetical protein
VTVELTGTTSQRDGSSFADRFRKCFTDTPDDVASGMNTGLSRSAQKGGASDCVGQTELRSRRSPALVSLAKLELTEHLVVRRADQAKIFERIWPAFRPGFLMMNLQELTTLAALARRAYVRAAKAVSLEQPPANVVGDVSSWSASHPSLRTTPA